MHVPSCDKCSSECGGLFGSLDERALARLMSTRVPHAYAPGQPLFFQGNPSLAVYCVRSGMVKLSRQASHGDEHVVGTRRPGDLLGYRAVLTRKRYRVTAEPLEPTIACTIPRDSFLELLRENTDLAFALLVRASRDTLRTEEQMLTRVVEGVKTRLARYLLQGLKSRPDGSGAVADVTLSMSREQLAHLIDTTPETLSRTLHALAERGVLEPDRHHIRVLNVPALERLARLEPPSGGSSPAPH